MTPRMIRFFCQPCQRPFLVPMKDASQRPYGRQRLMHFVGYCPICGTEAFTK